MTQEFHISVTPVGVDEYLVRTEHPLPGVPVAEEQISWPLDEWLTIARQLMNDPLSQLLQGNPSRLENPGESTEDSEQPTLNLVTLGRELHNALFQGSLRDSWMMAQAIAQNQRQKLRLRLGLKGHRLPRLPWEVLNDGYRTLATGTEVLFSRYWPTTNGLPVPPLPPPPTLTDRILRILMVVAAPTDRESLELRQEATELQRELHSRSDTGSIADIHLTILEQPDRATLTHALEQGQYQVLHYAGHSNLGNSGGAVYLVNSKTGRAEPLSGDDLAGLLVNNGIQMAVFNSCRGAYLRAGETPPSGEANLAQALVKRGIPAVLAMAESIPDEVALHLTRLFYRNLNQGHPVDLSLSRARQGLISSYGSHQLYWALPVLYMHPAFDGYLIRKSGSIDRDEPEAFSPLTPIVAPVDSGTSIDEVDLEGALQELEYPDVMAGEEDDDAKAIVAELLGELTHPPSPEPPSEVGDVETEETPKPDEAIELENVPPPSPLSAPSIGSAVVSTREESEMVSEIAKVPIDPTPIQPPSRKNWLLPLAGAIAILGLGTVIYRQLPQPVATLPPPSEVSPTPNSQPFNADALASGETGVVTNTAIEQFTAGNLKNGALAVEALLDRNALPQAKAALDTLETVLPESLSDHTILFLQGRMAWQFIQTSDTNTKFALDDVRRYWESSLKAQPNSVRYRQALGWAYYAQNQFDRAYESWDSARTTIDRGVAVDEKTGQPIAFAPNSEMALQVDAGLALALMKSARAGGNIQKQPQQLSQAVELRQRVLTAAPATFSSTDTLAKNWLWAQEALRDWQALLQLQG
ncbi:CHAT domain-containing protein [Oscillatoriales cyanobacterium LEGE 11467]|uniref:CHAT domain-containing protein n=1 Tax=Zarconia navalis LEGE 11467 TaxID=1828826 RepID=A0A928W0W7_9CYAN|nr:CHAT domain-containing protein [Zarconia navalis]MBE9041255.1 CHAT domain-containing protein [Zarconia navalis LEGE 11467]